MPRRPDGAVDHVSPLETVTCEVRPGHYLITEARCRDTCVDANLGASGIGSDFELPPMASGCTASSMLTANDGARIDRNRQRA